MRYATLILLLLAAPIRAAAPIFENGTPVGFVTPDSTTTQDFVSGATVEIRVDLNQAATDDHPVIGHFHSLERSEQLSTTDTDGSWVDVAMWDEAPFGTVSGSINAIHMAWIEASTSTTGPAFTGGSTPAYEVYYARSEDGGASFSSPLSVSAGLSYYVLSVDGAGSSFSTLDLEVDSRGNPRVTYAFVTTADHSANRNVYFAYSDSGGHSWKTPISVNDVSTIGTEGTASAFPRMVVDDRDEIFIAYERGTDAATGDIILAKVNRTTSPFSMEAIGSLGTVGSAGGVRLTVDGKRHTGVDLALGDDDALHAVYFSDADNRIEYKRAATDDSWLDVSADGWDRDVDGSVVGSFVDEAAGNTALDVDVTHFFPTIVVDRQRLPDRVYSVYKYADSTPIEGIYLNQYDDDGSTGASATWGTATTAWSTGATPLFADGLGEYGPELDWFHTERVAAFVDDRLTDERGDLHIAFSAGYSGSLADEHDIYLATYNGASWTLPEKVADVDSDGAGTEDGIANTDIYLGSPALTHYPDSDHLFLAFIGGTGEGYGINGVSNVDHHPYFKVLGRDITVEDESVPSGAYQYTLSYAPVNPQTPGVERADRPVWVHVADPTDGSDLGARDQLTDGFLAGTWERVGTSLQDTHKRYEGLIDESAGDSREWGDEDDKVGLLVKLNVLGSDSSTNLQVITSSSAAERSLSVATVPYVSLATGAYFQLGADIDIVASNNAPTVSISDPDGTSDSANTSYAIRYDLNDSDDDLSGTLDAAFYAYASPGLRTVQDIRIFATLIADQNDVSSRNASGTDDLTEGTNQTYTWDDPPSALQTGSLFASMQKVNSGTYYIYLVADDGDNQPVFAVSPGPVTILHAPMVLQVDPSAADTVDTGVRTGLKANPYDLDFAVVDYDSEARVQLFYAAVSGISSVSASGSYPNERFVLGKSLAGVRGTSITDSTTLSGHENEFDWDVREPLIPQGAYYLYTVASDGVSVTVGNSTSRLVVQHSPRFTFYEPARNTQRSIDSGSQPIYTIQWQKGPGDADLDDDASIALYFTSVDPATRNYAGSDPTDLLDAGDGDARLIVSGLSEDDEGSGDLYTWDLRQPPNEVPDSGSRVWLYAVLDDGNGNESVSLGGSLLMTHSPYILLTSSLPQVSQGDIVRLNWEDYMVDDGVGTDDAHIRLYASQVDTYSTLLSLETDLVGAGGQDDVYLINSSDGTATGTIDSVREDSSNTYRWDTRTPSFSLPEATYTIYAGINADATFAGSSSGHVSASAGALVVTGYSGTSPNLGLSPNRLRASVGDTLRFDVLVQSNSLTATVVSAIISIDPALYEIINPTSPFTDAGEVFTAGSVIEDTTVSDQVRFTKQDLGGEIIGSESEPVRLAQFAIVVKAGFSGLKNIRFDSDLANLSLSGSSVPLNAINGMSTKNALIEAVPRGRILTTVLLEGRSPPIGTGDHSTLLDVHLRLPGSTVDITDATYLSANDDNLATPDTLEVLTSASGAMTLEEIPPGRYVLTVKDTSHLSGRTDTISIRGGETIRLNRARFYASDLRGNLSLLLDQDGHRLLAGDVNEDNEIDEDDVNTVDAAWGSNAAVDHFAQADVNNDGRVGVEDLAVVISNISSLTGFGAPPVFKAGQASAVNLELRAPDHVGTPWEVYDEIDLVFAANGVQDLSAFELQISFDERELELVTDHGFDVGRIFKDNPEGWFTRHDLGEGRVHFAAARRGRQWSAHGEGELVRFRVRLKQDGFPASLRVSNGKLLSSQYATTKLELAGDPRSLAAPTSFRLAPNHPNPFNPSTVISFDIPAAPNDFSPAPVSVLIYNVLGQRVRELVKASMQPGFHHATWDGRDDARRALSTGIYFYEVRVGSHQQTGRMTMLR
jgi:hypothetical protein